MVSKLDAICEVNVAVDLEVLPEAGDEFNALPERERRALSNAIDKRRELGDTLGYPHSSKVQGTPLRELRPQRGNSPWRAFYQRRGDRFFISSGDRTGSVTRSAPAPPLGG